ncbi:MAG: hypothetical protein M5U34_09790 [Chloroflexi bacterium]|nr:hypothetical protein [Chloroflexota bacterium]
MLIAQMLHPRLIPIATGCPDTYAASSFTRQLLTTVGAAHATAPLKKRPDRYGGRYHGRTRNRLWKTQALDESRQKQPENALVE